MPASLLKLLQFLLTLGLPLWVGFGLFSASITPAYPRYEYNKATFPPDSYGWTNEQRLELALVAVDYLRRPEPADEVIYLLEDQRKPGTNETLYNEREIGHMLDVKRVSDGFVSRMARIGGALSVVGLGILFWQREKEAAFRGIMRGGMVLTLLLAGIGLFIGVAWNRFFNLFHEILFPPNTWSFYLDDSLIRLFPNKFWYDYGVLISGAILIAGILLWGLGYWLLKRVAK